MFCYLNALPLHPQPELLESFTSYLTRLAEANGIGFISDLSHVCFPGQNLKIIHRLKDYPMVSFGMLPEVAACPESVLKATTFCHLGEKFGRSTQPQPLGRFLNGSVACQLRYCPMCLAERPYHSLTWRFLALTGCVHHGCHLLDKCGHCGREIPLFAFPLRIGMCPLCGEDLGNSYAEPLDEVEMQIMQSCYRDLEFLLSPRPQEAVDEAIKSVGRRFIERRRMRGLTVEDMSRHLGIKLNRMLGIEYGISRYGANFHDYVSYADYLGITLQDVFAAIPKEVRDAGRELRDEVIQPSEDKLADNAPLVYQENRSFGSSRGRSARVPNLLGQNGALPEQVRESSMLSTPSPKEPENQVELVRETENRHAKKRSKLSESEMVEKIQEAMEQLDSLGRPVTQIAVAEILGMSVGTLRGYPRVKVIFDEIVKRHHCNNQKQFQLREEELVGEVQRAVNELKSLGKPVTKRAISRVVGVSRPLLDYYPKVRAILQQITREQEDSETKQSREKELVNKVLEAKNILESQGKFASQRAVSEIIGITVHRLKMYPPVKEILEQIAEEHQQNSKRRFQLREDELAGKVQEAIKSLEADGRPVTQQAIEEKVGMYAAGLRRYPRVRMILEEVAERRFCWRETELVDKVQQAVKSLQAIGKPVSQMAICEVVGMSLSGLRRYPRVRAILRQAAKRGPRGRKSKTRHYTVCRSKRSEDELVGDVEEAIENLKTLGKPVTQQAISEIVGMSPRSLRERPPVKMILDQIVKERRGDWARRSREAKLIIKVEMAIESLESLGKRVTQMAISEEVGMSVGGLKKYPRVRTIMNRVAAGNRRNRKSKSS